MNAHDNDWDRDAIGGAVLIIVLVGILVFAIVKFGLIF
jgi:hypothetical protein